MKVVIVSTFLLNLVTTIFIGWVFQDRVAEDSLIQTQTNIVNLSEKIRMAKEELDYKKYPRLRIGPFTKDQTELLTAAYEIGASYGKETREVVQGILLQESSAGTAGRIGGLHLPVGERYYGVMQMKVVAVQDVLKSHVKYAKVFFGKPFNKITSEEIIAKLITDDTFCIKMGYDYYAKYRKTSESIYEAIVAYNQGPGGVKKVEYYFNFDYTANVVKHIEYNVRPFNRKLEKEINTKNI